MSKNGKARGSVAREIEGVEQKLAACRRHLENVDFKLRKQELSEEGRKSLEKEKDILLSKVSSYEKELSLLRQENRKNMLLAVALFLLLLVIYNCWTI
ncbi:coiled-coil domain-containing protein 167 isoform X1 [Rhinatrema bivittatum]|uniref:coiled-coil domain-containing protein 167 isoform X1 n=1 Tax=Rhinatrema bivittatum TaxID=194408 RepID=UPI00112CE685|nr:coiled-coil domain-containing protein 167 isoform X1 [Rhinatrema bivittatum]